MVKYVKRAGAGAVALVLLAAALGPAPIGAASKHGGQRQKSVVRWVSHHRKEVAAAAGLAALGALAGGTTKHRWHAIEYAPTPGKVYR
jgi:hypothetical protein